MADNSQQKQQTVHCQYPKKYKTRSTLLITFKITLMQEGKRYGAHDFDLNGGSMVSIGCCSASCSCQT
jgi:hypothetical protein